MEAISSRLLSALSIIPAQSSSVSPKEEGRTIGFPSDPIGVCGAEATDATFSPSRIRKLA